MSVYSSIKYFWLYFPFVITAISITSGDNKSFSVSTDVGLKYGVATQKWRTTSPPPGGCKMSATLQSMSHFRHVVYYRELNFVYLNLKFGPGITLNENKQVVGEKSWVWTFYGKKGALKFLSWPIEFGIWSLGFLASYVGGPVDIDILKTGGDCTGLVAGNDASSYAISRALLPLTTALTNVSDIYAPSFWCYKERQFIQSDVIYKICLHFICPVEALMYRCCRYVYTTRVQTRVIQCTHKELFMYDKLWWIGPSVVAFVLFSYFPLLVMYMAQVTRDKLTKGEHDESWVFHTDVKPETLSATLLKPLLAVCKTNEVISSRIIRAVFPLLSLVFVVVQVILDKVYLQGFVLVSISKGVPLGFRSMLAGYNGSRHNFLPYLGGPYVAIILYVTITCFFIAVPSKLAKFLEDGINERKHKISPLRLDFITIERLGSIPLRSRRGYYKLYSVYLAQFFMLLNIQFWKLIFALQKERWSGIEVRRQVKFIFLPIYVVFCFLEIALSLVYYTFPIMSFSRTILCAYIGNLYSVMKKKKKPCLKLVFGLASIFMILCVVYFIFMFCVIFLDASLFLTRVMTFTYLGVIVYPKISYGCLIFSFTVLYYLWDSFRQFANKYEKLLKVTISLCESIQRANDTSPIVTTRNGFKGVKRDIFEHVIEMHTPRRITVFLSLLKVCTILTILGISLSLLMKMDKFRELHVVMHVGTALFICAFPQILNNMCSGTNERMRNRRFYLELKATIKDYLGYFPDEMEEEVTLDINTDKHFLNTI